jgi:phage N-6-adenine-methyltransferase
MALSMPTMPVQKPGKSFQAYGTPDELLAAVRRLLEIAEFDADLAASAGNAVCPVYFTEQDDSLQLPWTVGPGWNWLNPPFGNLKVWVKKAYTEAQELKGGARTAMLVPAGVGSNWWRDWVHHKADVLFLNGRLTFKGTPPNPKTGKPDPYPKDCALLLYEPNAAGDYDVWKWQ